MHLLTSVVGVVLVAAILWEVFADLFHPGDRAALSDWVGRGLFRSLRQAGPLFQLAGPLVLLVLIATWVIGLIIGFSLIYVGSFPVQFRTSTAAVPSAVQPLLSTLHFSFETLITLGYGDLMPRSFPMRLLSDVEALIGFGLLTASMTEIVLLYPALSRMRLLARSVAHLVEAERRMGLQVPRSGTAAMLEKLARDVTRARTDLVHFPIVYYFVTGDADASVARWTHQLCRFAHDGLADGAPEPIRLAAAALDASLTDLARVLAVRFVPARPANRDAVFEAFASDHGIGRA